MASPAVRLAQASRRRASGSEPSRTARTSERPSGAPPPGRRPPTAGCRPAPCRRRSPGRARRRRSAPSAPGAGRGQQRSTRACWARMWGWATPTLRSCAVSVRTLGARDLAAGARRRRAQHERQARGSGTGAALDIVAAPRRRGRDHARRLGEVERGAAADADDRLEAPSTIARAASRQPANVGSPDRSTNRSTRTPAASAAASAAATAGLRRRAPRPPPGGRPALERASTRAGWRWHRRRSRVTGSWASKGVTSGVIGGGLHPVDRSAGWESEERLLLGTAGGETQILRPRAAALPRRPGGGFPRRASRGGADQASTWR